MKRDFKYKSMKVCIYIILFFYSLGMQPKDREHVCMYSNETTLVMTACQQDTEVSSCCDAKDSLMQGCKKDCNNGCRCAIHFKLLVLFRTKPLELSITYVAQPEEYYRFSFITVQLPIWVPPEIN